jgi:hypothetical protein
MDIESIKQQLPGLSDEQVQALAASLDAEAQRRGKTQGARLVEEYLAQRNAERAGRKNALDSPDRPWRA